MSGLATRRKDNGAGCLPGGGVRVSELPVEDVKNYLWFIHKMCLFYDASLTGGPRTVERNRLVNGSPGSKHTFAGGYGCASDLVLEDPSRLTALEAEVVREGYHFYRGPGYSDGQCHIQMLKVGHKI